MSAKLDQQMLDAVKRRDYAAMKELLDKGADANAAEPDTGRTALYYAAALDMSNFMRGRMVTELLSRGALPDKTDDKGQTPFHVAAQRAGWDTMETLAKKGADVNARTKTGSTALHLAASVALGSGKTETMQKLLDMGANSLIRDLDGKTPRDRAKDKEGFTMFYATVISFLGDWEKNKPAERKRDDFTAANSDASREAAKNVQDKMQADSKRFKLKPAAPGPK